MSQYGNYKQAIKAQTKTVMEKELDDIIETALAGDISTEVKRSLVSDMIDFFYEKAESKARELDSIAEEYFQELDNPEMGEAYLMAAKVLRELI